MPLLGKKPFNCVKSLVKCIPEDTIFTIPHTKEQFRSKDDYDKRLSLYKERIWTCQCTGHINLSHEEAWNSEKAVQKTLRAQFIECYQKPVLLVVHHSILPLENLVDQAWLKLQQVLSLGEKVSLKVLTGGQVIKATVVKVDSSGVEADPTSNCSSPSSDKENTVGDRNKTDSSPKKWVPPKLLPYKYSIRLEDEDKIINAVPASEIVRTDKPPSKELLRLFIRAHAVRAGQAPTSPWVVDENLVKKYNLPSKYADFLLSPVKMAELSKRAEKEVPKKRKSITKKLVASSNKKLKFENKSFKNTDSKKQSKLMTSLIKKKSLLGKSSRKVSPKKSPTVVLSSSSDEDSSDNDCVLAEIKQNKIVISSLSDSDSDVPLSKVSKLSRKSSGSRQATPIKNLTPSKKSTPRKEGSLKHSNEKTPVKVIKSPSKSSSKKIIPSHKLKDKGKKLKKDEKKNRSPKKEGSKGMKQMTLLDMKKKGLKTPDRTFRKVDSPPRTPGMVKELLKLMKTDDKSKIGLQLRKVAICLSAVQRDRLPADIKNVVQKKFQEIEEKKKLKMMTPESKKAYFSEKRKDMKEKLAEVRKAKQEEQRKQRKRFEDQTLTTKALPTPKLVPMPEGLPNELFGDVAMATEFINCFSKLLMPDEEYPIYTDALMKALVTGKNGFTYLSRVLNVLLQTLLQDEIAENYSDLKIPLSDIPVNQFTVSELIRLCLRKMDDADDDSDHGSEIEDEELEVAEDVIQMLEGQELYDLDVVHKIKIIKGLCLRIMGSYSVQDYMEEKQRDASKLWRNKIAELKEKNDRLKEEKKKKQEHDTKQSKENLEEKEEDGKDANEEVQPKSGTSTPASEVQEDEVEDLASIVKRRRIMSALASKEKEKRDQEEKIKREKEYEILKKEREKENFEIKFQEGILLSKTVLRMVPVGTDRNHNRYWIFTSTTPGLYIEKGWINDDIDYKVEDPKIKEESNESSSDEMSTAESEATDFEKTRIETEETTVPHTGQNLWFTYDSLKDLDNLIECLHPQGYRESMLKTELQKQYSNIVKAINLAKRNNKELRDSDGDKEMLEGFKKELLETELKLRNGGLGGVSDFDLWEKKLELATDITVMAECLLETQEHVTEKFRQGVMKTKKLAISTLDGNDEEKEEKEEETGEEEPEGKGKGPEPVKFWRESVENASTLSRLHVLLGMLDSCIKWEKSAENAKCKICRKKGNDDRLLLCDDCNQAFHIYCLRPALPTIPRDDWFCPACIPDSARRKSRSSSYRHASDADSEDELEHEENCAECGGDEGLILCAECPLVYHLECHDPPLRHPPRGRWVCNDCKSGVKRKTRSKARRPAACSTASGRAVKRKRQTSCSTEEDDGSSDEEEREGDSSCNEEEEPPAKSARRTIQQASVSRSRKNKSRSQSKREFITDPAPRALSRRPPSDLSICENILNRVMSNTSSWPFLTAVDKKVVPDYYKIIKRPMDFTSIKNKLACLNYGLPEEFAEDVALVFRNAVEYNKLGSEVFDCMEKCEKFFVSLLHKKLPSVPYNRLLGNAAGSGRRGRR